VVDAHFGLIARISWSIDYRVNDSNVFCHFLAHRDARFLFRIGGARSGKEEKNAIIRP
jgi:hypothetical protein